MFEIASPCLSVADLERALKATDPAVLFVSPRVVRRVIKYDQRIPGIGLQVPHHKSYVIDRARLLKVLDRYDLDLTLEPDPPATLILIARPDPDRLAALPVGDALIKFWRLLFHARVHAALEHRLAEGQLTTSGIRQRIHRIGQAEFDEIRAVLRQENYLLAPRDLRAVYVEFAALYLELRYFARHLLPRYFPTVHDFERIDAILAEDVDGLGLFAATRLLGAPDPAVRPVDTPDEAELEEELEDRRIPPAPKPSGRRHRGLIRRAKKAAKRGNHVRAAILRAKAVRVASPEAVVETHDSARAELEQLAVRLKAALGLDEAEGKAWRQSLPALLERSARGMWPVEARLLYDLQKVCVDHERDVYSVDLVEWALALGRQPLKRHLPWQREVLMTKHLRSAASRLPACRMSEKHRRNLATLLHAAVRRSEQGLRDRLRPVIEDVLEEVGMWPQNYPEQIARHKLAEELLDRVSERGFLSMGDLRDTFSRNRLKLPDLSGSKEFVFGDRLIRTNRRLAVVLDGVYRGGEVYLRVLQRLSSLAFGTRVGRFLTRYVALPFGGAFVALEGLQHMVDPLARLFVTPEPLPEPPPEGEHLEHHVVHLVNPYSVAGLGVFVLALLHVPAFRNVVLQTLGLVFQIVRGVLYDLPVYLLQLPVVRRILESRPFWLFQRYLLRPVLYTAAAAAIFWFRRADETTTLWGSAAVFLGTFLLFNSRLGRRLEEVIADWLARLWDHIRIDLIPGLFRLVLQVFKRLLEDLERLLYTVDEWLRFKSGESQLVMFGKTVLGVVWFFATYLIRIYVNLLIEPTVNPIKHFPVVTVGAKIILPFSFTLTQIFAVPFMALGPWVANTIGGITVLFLPGIFGFLVWECKENWRLYRANQARTLRPVVIGHHGETMIRLLRPGFHSGTLPKLYAKLRHAEAKAARAGNGKAARKQREAIHHVALALRRFVEREFVQLLSGSKSWAGVALAGGAIDLGSNRIRVALRCPELSTDGLVVAFEEQGGWLVAGVAEPGWLPQLSREQVLALRTALAGFYKLAGIDLVREQIEAGFQRSFLFYDVDEEGLIVWPSEGGEVEAVYNLRDGPLLKPRITVGGQDLALPVLDADRVLYRNVPITWAEWVEAWDRDQAGKGQPELFLADIDLLPPDALGIPARESSE